ncbi:MAG: hypothetical protein KF893_08775 [Caldilineaceae bacterium]|nr:hypothetical protein [Caldilineaceae bacterium]
MADLARFLWSSSPTAVALTFSDPPEIVVQRLSCALQSNDEFLGKVVNYGFKLWRSRRYAQSRNTFAPILYGVVRADGEGSRIEGHFQLNPVMRLFLLVWFGGTAVMAAIFLIGGALRATPESSALDALPYLIPALLPLIGWLILRWQQRKGREDEMKIQSWIEEVVRSA